METDFFQFITTGKYSVDDSCFIDKLKYLGKIYLFIFCLGLTVSTVIEIISISFHSHTGGKFFDEALIKEILLQGILIGLIGPLFNVIFLIGLTHYHHKKVSSTISCIVSSFICLIIYKFFHIPVLIHQYVDVFCLFLFIFLVIYFCLTPIIRSYSNFLEKFWENKFLIVIFLSSILFSICIYLYGYWNFQSKIVNIMSFIIILTLIYIRATLGLKYAVLFNYLLSIPGIIVLTYLYFRFSVA